MTWNISGSCHLFCGVRITNHKGHKGKINPLELMTQTIRDSCHLFWGVRWVVKTLERRDISRLYIPQHGWAWTANSNLVLLFCRDFCKFPLHRELREFFQKASPRSNPSAA
jgi:hypothetical protein